MTINDIEREISELLDRLADLQIARRTLLKLGGVEAEKPDANEEAVENPPKPKRTYNRRAKEAPTKVDRKEVIRQAAKRTAKPKTAANGRKSYPVEFRLKVLAEKEAGARPKDLCDKYGIYPSNILTWQRQKEAGKLNPSTGAVVTPPAAPVHPEATQDAQVEDREYFEDENDDEEVDEDDAYAFMAVKEANVFDDPLAMAEEFGELK